jgi:hypothetical protein
MISILRFFLLPGFAILISSPVLAFNKDRCSKLFPTFDDDHPPYASPIYISTMAPSTTSYFSSIGPCAMYGKNISVARRFYIDESMSEIQVDVARGQGEHVMALAAYSGCPAEAHEQFATEMRANYRTLFAAPHDSYRLSQRIDKIIQATSLQKSCVK